MSYELKGKVGYREKMHVCNDVAVHYVITQNQFDYVRMDSQVQRAAQFQLLRKLHSSVPGGSTLPALPGPLDPRCQEARSRTAEAQVQKGRDQRPFSISTALSLRSNE
jgi:hypothetical protein